ncbi:hypothetical protein [Terrisporobacter sp.]|uniref:hypothetical protein n=1 Tax=Terrisporobacter sp. TaxID=1965305 RepID=UPI00262DA809|nr:hypothetical protein [Terrisporobacter sp.]
MKEKSKFINSLRNYYNHLLQRLDNGTEYLNKLVDEVDDIYNTKEYIAYENIIQELSKVKELIDYYNIDL